MGESLLDWIQSAPSHLWRMTDVRYDDNYNLTPE